MTKSAFYSTFYFILRILLYCVLYNFPSLGVNQTGSTNFSRVRTRCDFHPDPCSGMAKNHVCRPCAELLCRNRTLFQADPHRTHLRPSCDLNENLWSRFCARGASVTRWRARAEVRGGGPMFLGMGSSFYEIWVSNSVVISEFFFFGHKTRHRARFVS